MYAADNGVPTGPVLDALITALRGVPLARAVHSLRVFTIHHERELRTVEVLLDNQPWPAGQSLVASTIATPDTPHGLGIRLFALLSPAAQAPTPDPQPSGIPHGGGAAPEATQPRPNDGRRGDCRGEGG
jgi:Family of unknown function (DUF6348)